jgi:hypothetical protein
MTGQVSLEVETYVITNNCICEEYDEETGESLLDEHGYPVMSQECFGCYKDALDSLEYGVINPWLEANGYDEDTELVARGTGLSWRRLSGYANTTPKTMVETLSLDGDWTLRFTLADSGKTLSVVRYSHDEPTGTGAITFEQKPDEDEDELV